MSNASGRVVKSALLRHFDEACNRQVCVGEQPRDDPTEMLKRRLQHLTRLLVPCSELAAISLSVVGVPSASASTQSSPILLGGVDLRGYYPGSSC